MLYLPLDLITPLTLIVDDIYIHQGLHTTKIPLNRLGADSTDVSQLLPAGMPQILKFREDLIDTVDVIPGGIPVDGYGSFWRLL